MSNLELAAAIGGVVVMALTIGCVSWVVIKGFRSFSASSWKRLEELKAEYNIEDPDPEAVQELYRIRFFAYRGFFNTLGTTELDWLVPLERAEECINRLKSYSFRWGLFGAGSIFVPFSTMYHVWMSAVG